MIDLISGLGGQNDPGLDEAQLVLDLDGFEGPIDLLLSLAREQKVDLAKISILALADQYLVYVRNASNLRLELASDYLVMAAWLAYMKSRLLLPKEEDEGEESGEVLAEALAFQLRRLDAMRAAGQRLFALNLLGRDVFGRGDPEEIKLIYHPFYEVSLPDLLASYAAHRRRGVISQMSIEASSIYSVESAVYRLSSLLGHAMEWMDLKKFLPVELVDSLVARSALASTFAASLELAKEGKIEVQQSVSFGPIYVRARQMKTEENG
jgi:segregation and condensation protein A